MEKEAKLFKELGEQMEEDIKKETEEACTAVFVTMEHSNAMKIIAQLNDQSISAKIRNILTCGQVIKKFEFKRGNNEY